MKYPPDFESFWQAYPRKKAKGQCYKTWTKSKSEIPPIKVLLKAISDQKKERAFLKRSNRFVPEWKHASTWLNQQCWDDECEMPLRVTKAVNNSPGNGVDAMVRALNILTNLGEAKFSEFCAATKMPAADIEAVRFKYEGKYDVGRLAKGIG